MTTFLSLQKGSYSINMSQGQFKRYDKKKGANTCEKGKQKVDNHEQIY